VQKEEKEEKQRWKPYLYTTKKDLPTWIFYNSNFFRKKKLTINLKTKQTSIN
jgi:hypothetical protein